MFERQIYRALQLVGAKKTKLSEDQKQYVKKWKHLSKKELDREETKWSDFLWLGRHLYLKFQTTTFEDDFKSGDQTRIDIAKGAMECEEKVIAKYKDDPDFIRYMVDTKSENGDEEWKEITNNVGALRYLLWGEWDLSS